MQAVVFGQAAVAVAVAVGAIRLLSALASVKYSTAGATMMKKMGAETRSAFRFFSYPRMSPHDS